MHVYGRGQYTDPNGVAATGSIVHCHGKVQSDGKIDVGPDLKITTAAL